MDNNLPLVQQLLKIYKLPVYGDSYGMFVFDQNNNMMLDSDGHPHENNILSLFIKSFNQAYADIPAEFTNEEKDTLKDIKLPLLPNPENNMCILDGSKEVIARTRGWGKLQYYHNPEALHDMLHIMFIDAFNEVCGNPAAKLKENEEYCIMCGEIFMPGEDGNELGFCCKCQEKEDFPYDIEAYYRDYDAGKVAFKGFETMDRGILEPYKTYPNRRKDEAV